MAIGGADARPYLLAGRLAADGDGDLDRANTLLERAFALSRTPRRRAEVLVAHAHVRALQNNLRSARAYLLKAISLDSECAAAYEQLALTDYYQDALHPHVNLLRRLADNRDISREVRSCAHHTLGRIYDGDKQYDSAFRHFRRGNLCRRVRWSARGLANETSRRISVFRRELIDELARYGRADAQPIFIVGMPRSGTTLVEQVLDGHPDVRGAGERWESTDAVAQLAARMLWTALPYPECAAYLTPETIQAASSDLYDRLGKLAVGKSRVATKSLGDFWNLGLLHILFPRATILHCVRHPADVLLSCYMQRFKDVPYATSLRNTAAYFGQYRRLMMHWHAVLPAACIHVVEYEAFVSNHVAEVSRILGICGLDPKPSCHAFFANPRPVHTASIWQVRQPIYSGSVGRWSRYERYLLPFRHLWAAKEFQSRPDVVTDAASQGKGGGAAATVG